MTSHTHIPPDLLAIYERRHQALMMPTVRVQGVQGTGSGTVIYSRPTDGSAPPDASSRVVTPFSTFVLTNHHVIENLIDFKTEFSPRHGRMIKRAEIDPAIVAVYDYSYVHRVEGKHDSQAEIVTFDKQEDLALLRLLTDKPFPHVAKLFPADRVMELRPTSPVYAVGAGLGEQPVITKGMLCSFGHIMDNREYWLNTAAIIFGNSGGGLFCADTEELIGVPARIKMGSYSDAITHLAFAVPITRIHKFLNDQRFRFINDPERFTEKGEAEERKRFREQQELQMAKADLKED